MKRIRVEGLGSLKEVELELGSMTVLIGPNGAGKSNIIAAFKMLAHIQSQSLGRYVAERGGASALMYYGPKVTQDVKLHVEFEHDDVELSYSASLAHGAGDRLFFTHEEIGARRAGEEWERSPLGDGGFETKLHDEIGVEYIKDVRYWLRNIQFYHFHDTTISSALRSRSRLVDRRYLRSNGSNLAAYLLSLKTSSDENQSAAFERIERLVKRVAPFIKSLEPERFEGDMVELLWRDQRDEIFGVHHLSDGTIRAIAQITALSQPSDVLSRFIMIDEPELGLHPDALRLMMSLFRSVSARRQLLLSTQSLTLIDEVKLEDLVIVEHSERGIHGAQTQVHRLSAERLDSWLEEYKISELYMKNILGGTP